MNKVLIFIPVLVLCLTACGKDDDSASNSPAPATTSANPDRKEEVPKKVGKNKNGVCTTEFTEFTKDLSERSSDFSASALQYDMAKVASSIGQYISASSLSELQKRYNKITADCSSARETWGTFTCKIKNEDGSVSDGGGSEQYEASCDLARTASKFLYY